MPAKVYDLDPQWSPATALMWRVLLTERGDTQALDALRQAVEQGADLNAKNARGLTPLILALHSEKALDLLLSAGAPLRDANGRSEALEMARRFLDSGATAAFLIQWEARFLAARESAQLSDALPAGASPPKARV